MATPVGPSSQPHFPPPGGHNEKPNAGMTKRKFNDTVDNFTDQVVYSGSPNKKQKTDTSTTPDDKTSTDNTTNSKSADKKKEMEYEIKQVDQEAKQNRATRKADEQQDTQNEISGD